MIRISARAHLAAGLLGAGLLLAPSPGAAGALCRGLPSLLEAAQDGFPATAEAYVLSGSEPCDTALALSGGRSLHCAWTFAYRGGGARAAFGAFRQELERCLGPFAAKDAAQRVNHPDSYDQLHRLAGGALVTLSLKDKAALQKSYVFISIEGVPGD